MFMISIREGVGEAADRTMEGERGRRPRGGGWQAKCAGVHS